MDSALIERIVANVLEQIQAPGATAPSTSSSAPAPVLTSTPAHRSASRKEAELSATAASDSTEPLRLTDAVITAAVLEKAGVSGQPTLVVAPKAVLTPSAHDWLRQRRISWTRQLPGQQPGAAKNARWQLLATGITPTVRSLLDQMSRSHRDWERQLCGNVSELVELAGRLVTTAEVERVFVISKAAELVCCRVNRQRPIRAAVVYSVDHLKSIEADVAPNVVLVNPVKKSLMELRHLVQACSLLPPPQTPEWDCP